MKLDGPLGEQVATEENMNDRRRFLGMLGGGVVAAGAGCAAPVGVDVGAGGGGGAGTGTGGTTSTSTASTSTGSTTTSSTASSSSSSSGTPCTANPAGTELGKPSDFKDGLNVAQNTGFLVGKDAKGFYALTAICTHQGCDMSSGAGQVSSSGITCLCHHSRFNDAGDVIGGPACCPLQAFAMELGCNGSLYADPNKSVSSSERIQG
jgi:Rieske Fe-S protein